MSGYRSDCSLHFIEHAQARYDGTNFELGDKRYKAAW